MNYMNKTMILVLHLSSVILHATEFKPLSAHSAILYNLVDDYVSTHATEVAHNVYLYVNSDATKAVFNDAKKSGYERGEVVFEAYQLAFTSNPRKDVLIDGLHEVVSGENILKDAVFYSTWTNLGVSFLIFLHTIRSTYRYLKRHDPTNRNPYVPEPSFN